MVSMSQRFGRLQSPLRDLLRAKWTLGFRQNFRQAATIDELHRVVIDAMLTANVIDGNDVGVMQFGDRFRFSFESLDRICIGDPAESQDFKCHAAAKRNLFRFKNGPHTSSPHFPNDPKISQSLRSTMRGGCGRMNEFETRQTRFQLRG